MPFDPSSFFIIDPSMQDHAIGGLIDVGFLPLLDGYEALKGNVRIAATRIVPADKVGTNNRVKVYWCGFEKNTVQYSFLGKDSNIMLTPTMDGCSFGIGHHSKDGILVSHANMERSQKGIGEFKSMQKSQMNQIKNFFKSAGGSVKRVMSPSDYRLHKDEGDTKARACASATTFGVRTNDRWNFYRHRYLVGMGDYQLIDTKKI